VGIRAKQIWEDFMQSHGKALIQTLSLLKSTMGREASAVVGVVHSVNDPDTAERLYSQTYHQTGSY
jgi:hypothetical protein